MCDCNTNGTLNELNTCNEKDGQCHCKRFTTSLSCGECSPGFYSLKRSDILGCESCDCNPGTSINNFCDAEGQCDCLPNFTGKKCDQLKMGYYVQNLHQLKYELEDGLADGEPVRYGFNENVFKNYSWKGYVPMNISKISYTVNVTSPGNYKVIVHYLNTNLKIAEIVLSVTENSKCYLVINTFYNLIFCFSTFFN
jgi:hypothetical protein